MKSLPTFHHSLFRYEPEFRRFSADMSDLVERLRELMSSLKRALRDA